MPRLSLADLRRHVGDGDVDAVWLASTDGRGRLTGPTMPAATFLEALDAAGDLPDGAEEGDDDPDPTPTAGSLRLGSGPALAPDPASIRPMPWHAAAALVQITPLRADGRPDPGCTRSVLRRALRRLGERSGQALRASATHQLRLVPDPDGARSARPRPTLPDLLHEVTVAARGAGVQLQAASAGPDGRLALDLLEQDAAQLADDLVVLRRVVTEVAARSGLSAQYLAAPDRGVISGLVLRVRLALPEEPSEQALAGVLATARELCLLCAPGINSFKRLNRRPPVLGWSAGPTPGPDPVLSRLPAPEGLHLEHRVAGADADPYLALAALAAGLWFGLRSGLQPPPRLDEVAGAAPVQESDEPAARLPADLVEARQLLAASMLAREAFGGPVVDRLVAAADAELEDFDQVTTEWERSR